jgi:hypothetical protein
MFTRITKNKEGSKHIYSNTDTSPDLRKSNAPVDHRKYSCEQFGNDCAYVQKYISTQGSPDEIQTPIH